MTTLSDLLASVITVTNRPDLVAESTLAIQKATLKEHSFTDYKSDIAYSGVISLTDSAGNFRYQISQVTVGMYPQCRKILKIGEVLSSIPVSYLSFEGYWGEIDFTEQDVDDLFDGYRIEKSNYYTRVGNLINLVALREVTQIGISYYALPNISNAGYSSWIADKFPYVIYEVAAADIFDMIGKTDESKLYLNKVQSNRLDILKSEITV